MVVFYVELPLQGVDVLTCFSTYGDAIGWAKLPLQGANEISQFSRTRCILLN